MPGLGIRPSLESYSIGMTACAKGGRWQEALQLLREMKDDDNIKLDVVGTFLLLPPTSRIECCVACVCSVCARAHVCVLMCVLTCVRARACVFSSFPNATQAWSPFRPLCCFRPPSPSPSPSPMVAELLAFLCRGSYLRCVSLAFLICLFFADFFGRCVTFRELSCCLPSSCFFRP